MPLMDGCGKGSRRVHSKTKRAVLVLRAHLLPNSVQQNWLRGPSTTETDIRLSSPFERMASYFPPEPFLEHCPTPSLGSPKFALE
jgi:hypothetical protein